MKKSITITINSLTIEILKNITVSNIENIISKIRTSLYFSESFSCEDIQKKKTNCVGANYILLNILESVYPKDVFKFVSITYPAFETKGHLSKHICVAQIKDNEIRFIDATPMAGFFNGRISKWLFLREWKKENEVYVSKSEMNLKDFEDRYAYSFSFLTNKSVTNVLEYVCLKEENNLTRFDIKYLPKAWFADLLKDKALNSENKKKKNELLKQSYQLSKNPFTYLKLYPDRKQSDIVVAYVNQNKLIIKKIDSYLKQNKNLPKNIYFEYLAVKYWKQSANKQILGTKFDFKHMFVGKDKIYLYKIGRSYFKDNKFVLLKEIKGNKTKFSIVDKRTISGKEVGDTVVYTGINAYEKLLLKMSPEVIIL